MHPMHLFPRWQNATSPFRGSVQHAPVAGLLIALVSVCAAATASADPVPPALVNGVPQPAALPQLPGGAITRFIRATGYGVVKAKPGEAHVSFLVSTNAPSAVGALQDNAKQVNKVVQGLRDSGVASANILWSESSLANPPKIATSPSGTSVDTGDTESPPTDAMPQFTANARIEVKTYEVSHASEIVQIGMFAGASSVLGMTFAPRNPEELKQQALVAALKDAASKAAIMAAGVNVRVLYAISVSEMPATAPEPPGQSVAPPAEIAMPMNIEVVYAVG